MTTKKVITVKDVVDALKKNGFEQVFGQYLLYEGNEGESKIIGGCAYGQAAVNLGLHPDGLADALETTLARNVPDYNPPNIIHLNDTEHVPVSEIGEILEKWATKHNALNLRLYPDIDEATYIVE